jgi:hypothetical protein
MAKKEKDSGKARMQGYLVPEGAISFFLSFVSYNKATKGSEEGIIVDKVIESEFYGGQKMVIEFETPIILSQKNE